jgi:tRNA(Ile)-lysidine synthase
VGVPPQLAVLQALSPERQANVLRHWLLSSHQTTPAAAQLAELMRQIAACTTRGHRIHIKVGRGFIERRGAGLDWYNPPVLD